MAKERKNSALLVSLIYLNTYRYDRNSLLHWYSNEDK